MLPSKFPTHPSLNKTFLEDSLALTYSKRSLNKTLKRDRKLSNKVHSWNNNELQFQRKSTEKFWRIYTLKADRSPSKCVVEKGFSEKITKKYFLENHPIKRWNVYNIPQRTATCITLNFGGFVFILPHPDVYYTI
jgi:hypothetical protein